MRSFEERKREIFNRSDELIKKNRQKNKKVMFSCVPLLVCAVIVISFYLTNLQNNINQTNKSEANDEFLAQNVTMSILVNYGNNELSIQNEDNINFLVENVLKNFPEKDGETSNSSTASTVDVDNTLSNEIYKITFCDNGEKVEFLLIGNVLKNSNTQQEITLNDEEFEALSAVLEAEQKETKQ